MGEEGNEKLRLLVRKCLLLRRAMALKARNIRRPRRQTTTAQFFAISIKFVYSGKMGANGIYRRLLL